MKNQEIPYKIYVEENEMPKHWYNLRADMINKPAPLLNANGWAVNAASKISIPFGETLTSTPKYPKMNLKDPYAKTGMPTWKKWFITIIVLGAAFVALWFTNKLEFVGLKSTLSSCQVEVVVDIEVSEDGAAEASAPSQTGSQTGE